MAWYTSIYDVLEDIKQDIIDEYEQKGLKASGAFERSLNIRRQGRGKVMLSIPPYSQFISKFKSNRGGRKPGGFPPLSIIEQWVKDKGLQIRDITTGRFRRKTPTTTKQVAFLIARKIAEKGTDIHLGKREAIDLDRITDNVFDYKMDEIADRIIQEMKI